LGLTNPSREVDCQEASGNEGEGSTHRTIEGSIYNATSHALKKVPEFQKRHCVGKSCSLGGMD
jgi:hypothetical protein